MIIAILMSLLIFFFIASYVLRYIYRITKLASYHQIRASITNISNIKCLHFIEYEFESNGKYHNGGMKFLSDDLWVVPKYYFCDCDDDKTREITAAYLEGDDQISIYYSPDQKRAICFMGHDINWLYIHLMGLFLSVAPVVVYCVYYSIITVKNMWFP